MLLADGGQPPLQIGYIYLKDLLPHRVHPFDITLTSNPSFMLECNHAQ